jgi:hypothetical protein
MTFFDPEKTLISDTECYGNLWSIGFRRVSDGKTLVMEQSHRRNLNRERLAALLKNNLIIGYNWTGYDQIMVAAAVAGFTTEQLKQLNDRIILGGLKWWEVDKDDELRLAIPRSWKFIDLMEPQPNAFASLKTLAGRMHSPRMQDLPYEPDSILTEAQMDEVLSYMGNDLDVTHRLFDWLREPLELRDFLTNQYDINLMSKSDAQIGEAIIKKVAEDKLGRRIYKPEVKAGTSFKYEPPAFLRYTDPQLQSILDRIRETKFVIQKNGKVDLPAWISETPVVFGDTTFAMGIGGLHSTEKNRSVHADEEYIMADADVTGYYPQIIINSGLFPPAIGAIFTEIFAHFKHERDRKKPLLKNVDGLFSVAEVAYMKSEVEGYKIVGNGSFGKTSSMYSVLWSPPLTIYTTITGQLSILMLINMIYDAGAEVVSANTDGIVIRARREMLHGIAKERVTGGEIKDVIEQWERETGFNLEAVEYQSIYNQSVNTYIAVKPDGSAKMKGAISNPWRNNDKRGSLMKNPQATIVSDAVVDFITKGIDIEETIRGCTDIRGFVTVVNVKGGGVWVPSPQYATAYAQDWERTAYQMAVGLGDARYLGKVVRYIWGKDGSPIYYKTPDPRTGNFKKVPKSDGCLPMMDLPDEFPAHLIDYDRYLEEAREMLMDIGFDKRPDPIKPVRLFKWSAPLYWALAV